MPRIAILLLLLPCFASAQEEVLAAFQDTTSAPPPPAGNCPSGEEEVIVQITTDDYPGETTWEITDQSDSVWLSGGSYFGSPGVTFRDTICLPEDCYEFTIFDDASDGICCDYGNGSYSVTQEGDTIKTGGVFGDQESFLFCTGNATPACLTTGIDSDFGVSQIWSGTGYTNPSASIAQLNAGDFIVSECIDLDSAGVSSMDFIMSSFWSSTRNFNLEYSTDNGSSYTLLTNVAASSNPSPFSVSLSSISSETNVIFRITAVIGPVWISEINFSP